MSIAHRGRDCWADSGDALKYALPRHVSGREPISGLDFLGGSGASTSTVGLRDTSLGEPLQGRSDLAS
jgi:hypothetical protein